MCIEGCNARITVRLEPGHDNRALVVEADSPAFSRRSTIQLDGDRTSSSRPYCLRRWQRWARCSRAAPDPARGGSAAVCDATERGTTETDGAGQAAMKVNLDELEDQAWQYPDRSRLGLGVSLRRHDIQRFTV
jgi:hypothetical protein